MITLHGVTKRFGTRQVLAGIDLEVDRFEDGRSAERKADVQEAEECHKTAQRERMPARAQTRSRASLPGDPATRALGAGMLNGAAAQRLQARNQPASRIVSCRRGARRAESRLVRLR